MVHNNVQVAVHPVRAERAVQPGGVNHDIEFADRRAAVGHELERGAIVIVIVIVCTCRGSVAGCVRTSALFALQYAVRHGGV